MSAAFPPRILALLKEMAERNPVGSRGPWEYANGERMQDDADAALAWIAGATPPQQTEVRVPTSEDEAVAMNLISHAWLQQNAPHRLRAQQTALEVSLIEAEFGSDSHECFADFLAGVRFAERAHGVATSPKEQEHGN